MKDPLIANEIIRAILSIKNNNTAGMDQLKTEQLKYGPHILPSIIAEFHVIRVKYPMEIFYLYKNPVKNKDRAQTYCTS